MPSKLTWEQALAWRMERQLLLSASATAPEDVVRRLGGVQAQVASAAALAICVRSRGVRPAEVAAAIAEGRLIKAWAMRGTLHLITPDNGPAILSLLAASRWWERPAFTTWFGVGPMEFEALREAVREAVDGTALTKAELAAAVAVRPGLRHLDEHLRGPWGTLLHPLMWLGDLCFGPARDGNVTFTRPEAASRQWVGLPHAEEAAPRVVALYLGAYGPARVENFRNWLAQGRVLKKQVQEWFRSPGDRLVELDVEGERAYAMAEDVDDLLIARPTKEVRLVPGFDQYVLGGGTKDVHVIPAARRPNVSRQSGWIAPSVIAGGVVHGTWAINGDQVRVAWFSEAGRPPKSKLEAEVERLGSILDRDFSLEIARV